MGLLKRILLYALTYSLMYFAFIAAIFFPFFFHIFFERADCKVVEYQITYLDGEKARYWLIYLLIRNDGNAPDKLRAISVNDKVVAVIDPEKGEIGYKELPFEGISVGSKEKPFIIEPGEEKSYVVILREGVFESWLGRKVAVGWGTRVKIETDYAVFTFSLALTPLIRFKTERHGDYTIIVASIILVALLGIVIVGILRKRRRTKEATYNHSVDSVSYCISRIHSVEELHPSRCTELLDLNT